MKSFFPHFRRLAVLAVLGGLVPFLPAAVEIESGAAVVVVFNARMPESKEVAEYYARKRFVPDTQLIGLDLPSTEAITRDEYLDKLEKPLLKKLETARLLVYQAVPGGETNRVNGVVPRKLESAQIRYLVLCYGVPLIIRRDTNLIEAGAAQVREELRRNEASVDSQLAVLPGAGEMPLLWSGPLNNPVLGATNVAQLHPTKGVLMVVRLDGPSAAIAKGLVDKALVAERDGLWGRAYIDARGLTNANYLLGDTWMLRSADICRRAGFETVLDTNEATFNAAFPLSQVAIYAGWYDGAVSGPFARPSVEFMPGAFAYHLHSFSAATIRSTNQHWVGPLLARGATCTFGSVDEPYLAGTLILPDFFLRFLLGGFTFGEAAYSSQLWLSWQNIVVGDPLYRPFARRPDALHAALAGKDSPLIEWSHLRIVNLNLATGAGPADAISYLTAQPQTRKSAVLTEKLADLYWENRKLTDALETYESALRLNPTPQQKLRLLLTLARHRAVLGPDKAAYAWYDTVLLGDPDYADRSGVLREMLALARRMNNVAEIERCHQELKKLGAAPEAR